MIKKIILAASLLPQLVFADLTISEAVVRLMPPTHNMTAAFMKIENTGDQPVTLVSVSTDVSQTTEFHTHEWKDGVAKMQQLSSLTIQPKQTLELKSGGHHLMLFNLIDNWSKQPCVEIILKDNQQNSYSVHADIQKSALSSTEHHH